MEKRWPGNANVDVQTSKNSHPRESGTYLYLFLPGTCTRTDNVKMSVNRDTFTCVPLIAQLILKTEKQLGTQIIM